MASCVHWNWLLRSSDILRSFFLPGLQYDLRRGTGRRIEERRRIKREREERGVEKESPSEGGGRERKMLTLR